MCQLVQDGVDVAFCRFVLPYLTRPNIRMKRQNNNEKIICIAPWSPKMQIEAINGSARIRANKCVVFSTSQETAEKRICWNDLFCVERDTEPELNLSSGVVQMQHSTQSQSTENLSAQSCGTQQHSVSCFIVIFFTSISFHPTESSDEYNHSTPEHIYALYWSDVGWLCAK